MCNGTSLYLQATLFLKWNTWWQGITMNVNVQWNARSLILTNCIVHFRMETTNT